MPNNRSRLIKEILMGTLVLTNSSLTRRYGPSVGSDVNLVDQAGTYLIPAYSERARNINGEAATPGVGEGPKETVRLRKIYASEI
jgi:hypothetical protein